MQFNDYSTKAISTLTDKDSEEVARRNNDKLLSRQSRGKIHGSGDDR